MASLGVSDSLNRGTISRLVPQANYGSCHVYSVVASIAFFRQHPKIGDLYALPVYCVVREF